MSAFDPVQFLGSTYSEGFDTRIPLHKPGEWAGYIGTGEKDISPRQVNRQDGTQATIVDMWFYTEDPSAVGEGGRPPARARKSFWLDFTDGGNLDFSAGHNRDLGFLLTSLGFQDKNGKSLKPWGWKMLPGMRLKYRVEHEIRKDTGEPVANVTGLLPA